MPPEDADAVAAVCAAQGFSARVVPPSRYGLTLEQAAGLAPAPSAPSVPSAARIAAPDPMLLFVLFPPDDRDRLLDMMRRRGIAVNARKAILTAANRRWDARRLSRALQEEHTACQSRKGVSRHE